MNVSRRSLLLGAVGVGAVGAGATGHFDRGLFRSYDSKVWVRNRRPSSVDVEIAVSNLDEGETVLDESVTLAPEETFRKEGVLADDTE